MGCDKLKKLQLPNRLEKIGDRSFYGSGLEEILLPKTLVGIGLSVFPESDHFAVIQISDECDMNVYGSAILSSRQIGPPLNTMAGTMSVWGSRMLKNVIIPEGV